MSELPALRELIRAELATDLGIQMYSGFADLDAGSVRQDVGYVWTENFSTSEPAILQEVEVHARVYLQYITPRSPERPIDPAALEDMGAGIRDAIANRRATGGWLIRFRGVLFSYEQQYAEAIMNVIRENPYELAETTG